MFWSGGRGAGAIRGMLSCAPLPPPTPGTGQLEAHRVFAAQHEADLAAGVGRDGAVGVAHHGEERPAEVLHVLDEVQVQPLALAWGGGSNITGMTDLPQPACLSQLPEALTLAAKDAVLLEGRLHELVIGLLEEALGRACGARDEGHMLAQTS